MARKRRKKRIPGPRRAADRVQLSLCMIARDEADFLDRCLRSVEGLVDEIVVVDTGSKDATKAVARRHGARLFSFRWTGDFAAARNASLERARGRWILILDCDELLAARDHQRLRALIGRDDADAYRLTTRNYVRDAGRAGWQRSEGVDYAAEERGCSGWFPTTKVRLWRRDPRIRFRGAVHELVEPAIEAGGGRIRDCLVPVHHHGYVEKDRPADRYVEAGERKLQEDPADLQARYELAIAYRDAGRLEEGLAQMTALRQGMSGQALVPSSSYLDADHVDLLHADLLDRAGRLNEALVIVETLAARRPDSAAAYNNAGSLLSRLGRQSEALRAYRRAHELAPDQEVIAANLRQLEARLEPGPAVERTPGGDLRHAISVCIIARDCARDLRRCLESVVAVADEIVVVDTGSRDDTVAVAESFGAVTGHFPWCDDFAAARNESLRLAAVGDWVLWLDADDFLLPEDRDKLVRVKGMPPDQGLQFTLVNTGGVDRTSFRQVKMFPRRDDIRFERPVHETVLPALRRLGLPLRRTDIRVMHTGYAEAAVVARKTDYYRRLMEIWTARHPEDLDLCFRLGHTAYAAGDRLAAITYFDRILKASGTVEPRSLERRAAVFRGRCRLEEGNAPAAIPDFEHALSIDGGDLFAHACLGDALTKAGQFERARHHLRQALAGRLEEDVPLDRQLIDYSTFFFLGQCLAALGDHDGAVAAIEAAQRLQPGRPEATAALRQLRPSRAGPADPETTTDSPPRQGTGPNEEGLAPGDAAAPASAPARLSLCMIVRDEEQRLGRCLDSVAGLVDEIVVVDTGSTDNTVEVARRYGAVLGSFPWCDDFAAARNESLRLATGDWIMWLDADDVLPQQFHQPIRQLVAGPRDRSYFFVLDDRGYENVSCLQMRLFPNVENVRFEMPIHEQVTPSLGRLGIDMRPTDIRVVHTGYTTPEVVRSKKARYLRIMERWLERHPDDYIVRSHVALTYHTTGRFEAALTNYRYIIEQTRCLADHNYVVYTTSLLFLGRTYLKLGRVEDALKWIGKAHEFDADYILCRFSLAEAHLAAGHWQQAVEAARSVLDGEIQMTFFPIDRQELTYSSLCVLGRALAQLDDVQGAEEALRRAADTGVARRSEAFGLLAEIHKEKGRPEAAYAALTQALSIAPQDPKHRFNRGMLDLDAGRLDAAREAFLSVLEVSPGYAPALMNLGFIAKSTADLPEAERRYRQVLEQEADNADAHANLGHLFLGEERYAEAEDHFLRVQEKTPDLLDIQLGLLQVRLAQERWDPALAQMALGAVPEVAATADLASAGQAAPALLQLGVHLVHRQLLQCAQMAFVCAVLGAETGSGTANGRVALQARRCLGEIYITQGLLWRAIGQYEILLRADASDAEAFRRLGDCYTRLGVEDAARMCYDHSRQLST